MMGLPIALVQLRPAPMMSWTERIAAAVQQPISARLQNNLKEIERTIDGEITMRGDAPTDDECVALLTVRNYIGQCDEAIPKPRLYEPPAPRPKAPRKPPMEPKSWEETMDADEVEFCENAIAEEIDRIEATCADNWRAARMWKSSQRRRFSKQRDQGCCGSHDFVVQRWSAEKKRYDLYLLGFNYGH